MIANLGGPTAALSSTAENKSQSTALSFVADSGARVETSSTGCIDWEASRGSSFAGARPHSGRRNYLCNAFSCVAFQVGFSSALDSPLWVEGRRSLFCAQRVSDCRTALASVGARLESELLALLWPPFASDAPGVFRCLGSIFLSSKYS